MNLGISGRLTRASIKSPLTPLILLGADPLVDVADRSLARRAVAGARTVISLDRSRQL